MSGLVRMVVGLGILSVGLLMLPLEAQARMCRERSCVKRAPFICPGKPGSCGFVQGACLRWSVRVVPCGGPFVQPR